MKKIKYLSLFLIAGLFPFVLSSCLGDDDDNPFKIDPAYYRSMVGNYSGSVQYINTVDEKSEVVKVEGVSMSITADSVIRVAGIPAEAFTKNIKDEAIKNAIAAAPSPAIKAKFVIYSAGAGENIGFVAYPETVEFKNITVGEATHDYKIEFFVPSNGVTNAAVTLAGVEFYMATLYEDGVEKQRFATYSSDVTENLTLYVECSK